MYLRQNATNKKPKINYFEYQRHENEPKIRRYYAVSPELEDELLDNGYFLKRRVWRNMKKIRREYSRPVHEHSYEVHEVAKIRPIHTQFLHKY